jgi:hypothetical protein
MPESVVKLVEQTWKSDFAAGDDGQPLWTEAQQ